MIPGGLRLGTLMKNEWIKTRKRPATLVIVGLFTLIVGGSSLEQFLGARRDPDRTFFLPDAWPQLFDEDLLMPAMFFACVLLMLLVASEFSWRTARQNVIDGLSKEQWFFGKKLMLLIVPALFIGVILLFGGSFAALGTDPEGAGAARIGIAQIRAIGGVFVGFVGMASLALTSAMTIRSTGPAIAVWFLYIGMIEQGFIPLILNRLGEWTRPALEHLPSSTAISLFNYWQYDSVAYAAHTAAREAAERDPSPLPGLPTWELVVTMLLWIVFFVTISYLSFRKRDL